MQSRPQLRLLRLTNYLLIALVITTSGIILATTSGLYDLASAHLAKYFTPMELNPEAIGGVVDTSDQDISEAYHQILPSHPQVSLATPEVVVPQPTTTPTARSSHQPAPPNTIKAKAASPLYIIPIRYEYVSRGIIRGVHTGIDFVADTGTPVSAARGGIVIEADSTGWNGGWGKYILVQHESGVTTRYAHLSKINVAIGQTITQGQTIALSGSTGNSTGPHLHFELRINGKAVNPFK